MIRQCQLYGIPDNTIDRDADVLIYMVDRIPSFILRQLFTIGTNNQISFTVSFSENQVKLKRSVFLHFGRITGERFHGHSFHLRQSHHIRLIIRDETGRNSRIPANRQVQRVALAAGIPLQELKVLISNCRNRYRWSVSNFRGRFVRTIGKLDLSVLCLLQCNRTGFSFQTGDSHRNIGRAVR